MASSFEFNEVSPTLIAADIVNMQAGGKSFWDSAYDFGTKGVGSAALSGFASIYNTGVAIANTGFSLVGGEGDIGTLDVAETLRDYDENWHNYYVENKQAIDVAGFIATSIIPGGLALKGMQLAKAGSATSSFARALALPAAKKEFYLKAALTDLASEGGTAYSLINANKVKALAWGTADQALTAAAMEIAVVATMKQSPLLEADDWGDVAWNVAKGAAFGGLLGGGVEAILIHGRVKAGANAIAGAQRSYDLLNRFDNMNLAKGDEAYGLVRSIVDLPETFVDTVVGKGAQAVTLDTKELFKRVKTATEKRGLEEFQIHLNKLAGGDAEVGNALGDFLLGMYRTGKEQGAAPERIKERMADYLLGSSSASRITEAAETVPEVFYVSKNVNFEELTALKSVGDILGKATSTRPSKIAGADTFAGSFKIVGDAQSAKVGIVGKEGVTVADIFEQGFDLAVDKIKGLKVNPKSAIFRPAKDPVHGNHFYLNTRTGGLTETATLVFGDLIAEERIAAQRAAATSVGKFNPAEETALTASAKFAHVAGLQPANVPSTVSSLHYPYLDKILQGGQRGYADITIEMAAGNTLRVGDIPNFADFVASEKLATLRELLSTSSPPLSELAARLNTSQQWIENAITARFDKAAFNAAEGISIPLESAAKVQNIRLNYSSGYLDKQVILDKAASEGGESHKLFGELAFQYRVKQAQEAAKNASTAVLGVEVSEQLLDFNTAGLAKMAKETGTGAGTLSFSNADYGNPVALFTQTVGKVVNRLRTAFTNKDLDAINHHILRVREEPVSAAELGVLTTFLRNSPDKYVLDVAGKRLVLAEVVGAKDVVIDTAKQTAAKLSNKKVTQEIESDAVVNFLAEHVRQNTERRGKYNVLLNAQGVVSNVDPRVVYAPSIDTARYPFFAFVRELPGHIAGSSEVRMITAKSAQELKQQAARVPEGYEVIFKDGTDRFFKAKGEYDRGLTISESRVDNSLHKAGVLADFFPETRAENVLEDYVNFIRKSNDTLVRAAVETRYMQPFNEIKALGAQYTEAATSKFAGVGSAFRKNVADPFGDIIKTALDISKQGEYPLLHEANEFVNSLGRGAYRAYASLFEDAQKGLVSWEDANRQAEKYGIAGPYTGVESYLRANTPADRNLIQKFVSKANMTLVNFGLRFDMANSIVNIISTPITLGMEFASIKHLVKNDPALAGKLAELTTLTLPDGSNAKIPSLTKLVAKSFGNFFGAEKEALVARYMASGDIKDTLSRYHEMVDNFTYKPWETPKRLGELADKGTEIAAKLSGNNFAEQFTRFVSADVMRQLTDPLVLGKKLSTAEQNAFISTFVNRVQGNYIASQRPLLFQGVLGSAVSLFQTYQVNLLQQLFRHIENKDTKTVMTMLGLQSGIYGLNGVPFFEAVNTHLIGNSSLNPGHNDAYSVAPQTFGKELGDWLMYGTASAFPVFGEKSPALFTRGDINPRHVTILPTSPWDVPAVSASIKVVKNLLNVGEKLMQGGGSGALLEGLEHNGLSRPLAGIAQNMQQHSTNSHGALVSEANDFTAIAMASRVLGARPMDEALFLAAQHRTTIYKAKDRERMDVLGQAVKTRLRAGEVPSDAEYEEFLGNYAKAGGRIENYSAAIQRWTKDANVSIIDQMRQKHQSTYAQRIFEITGGSPEEETAGLQTPPAAQE